MGMVEEEQHDLGDRPPEKRRDHIRLMEKVSISENTSQKIGRLD